MSWAAALHRAIEWTSLTGAGVAAGSSAAWRSISRSQIAASCSVDRPVALSGAVPHRELDADVTRSINRRLAALIAALDKLERHHAGFPVSRDDGATRLLRSHPATSERATLCSALPKGFTSNYVSANYVSAAAGYAAKRVCELERSQRFP